MMDLAHTEQLLNLFCIEYNECIGIEENVILSQKVTYSYIIYNDTFYNLNVASVNSGHNWFQRK